MDNRFPPVDTGGDVFCLWGWGNFFNFLSLGGFLLSINYAEKDSGGQYYG